MAVLNEEQTMLRDAARSWARESSPVTALRKLRDSGSGRSFEPATWAQMGQMGWAGVIIPEEYGGSNFGYLSLALILEETGRTLTASPLISTALTAASALMIAGSEDQKQAWLTKIAAGEIVAALAVDEGPHHHPEKTALAAKGGKLSGKKTFVIDGMEADLLIVAARTSGQPGETDGISLYLVKGDAKGVTRERLALIDSRGAAEITFDGAQGELLGEEGKGWGPLEQTLDRARAGLAAEMLGSSSEAFDVTLEYLKTRTQFGQVIGTFQALQHRAAKMFTDIETTRSVVEMALQMIDDGGDVRSMASIAKAKSSDLYHYVSNEMVQLHGGIGMTDEFDIGFYLKRARVLEASFGSSSQLRARFARLGGY